MAYLDENGLEHFWGKIKDHVSSAIAPKADDADVLHKTGTETVSGEKVFSGTQTTAAGNETALMVIKDATLTKGEIPATNHFLSLGFIDSTGNSYAQDVSSRLATVQYKSPSETSPSSFVELAAFDFNGGDSAFFQVGHDKDNIQFASAPATSDDRTNATDIVTRGYMEASEWNWQKTKKNALVQFKPAPESALEPVVDFMFTETPPASGEKGPGNPSTISPVSSVKVTRGNKNLLSQNFSSLEVHNGETKTSRGVTCSNNNGVYTLSGTTTGGGAISFVFVLAASKEIFLHPGTYYISGFDLTGYASAVFVQTYDDSGQVLLSTNSRTATSFTITAETAGWGQVFIRCADGDSYPANFSCSPQLEIGSSATTFEPGVSTVYTLTLGDTYYGGSLDVSTGVMTVTWVGKVLTDVDAHQIALFGTAGVDSRMVYNITQHGLPIPKNGSSYSICSHSNHYSGSNIGVWGDYYVSYASNNVGYFVMQDKNNVIGTTEQEYSNWVASQYSNGTPVTFAYAVATPFTVQLTPTQIRSLPALDKYEPRINTVYTDQEAVQVGYQRYANYVDLTTDQTIDGEKIFRRYIRVKDKSFSVGYSVFPYDTYSSRADVLDSLAVFNNNDKRLSLIRTIDKDSNGNRVTSIYTMPTSGGIPGSSALTIGLLDVDGAAIGYAQAESTPEYEADGVTKRTSGKDIVTRDWIPKDTRIVHTTGNETIGGEKTFSNKVTITNNPLNIIENDAYIINSTPRTRYYICRFTNLTNKLSHDSSICAAAFGLQTNNGDIPVALYNQINTNGDVSHILRHNHVSGSDVVQLVFLSQAGKYEGSVYCSKDNKYQLGDSNVRWTAVYAATGSIQTSDERLKTEIAPLPDNVLDAWGEVEWKQFKFTDSVDEKGLDAARLHAGAIAQSIDAVFSAAGLDAGKYGFFCHDSWEAKEAEYDENGSLLNSPREAGDRYSLRYEEALCMEAAFQRRENARLKKRIADLEERLAALELKIS